LRGSVGVSALKLRGELARKWWMMGLRLNASTKNGGVEGGQQVLGGGRCPIVWKSKGKMIRLRVDGRSNACSGEGRQVGNGG